MLKTHLSRLLLCVSLTALLVGLDSCKKSDDPTTTQATLAGSYKLTALTVTPSVQGIFTDLIAASKVIFNGTTCLNDLTITFSADGTATTNNPSSCQSIPVPVSTFTGIDASSKWVQNNTTLTVTKGDGTKTDYTILSTSPTLKLQWQSTLTAVTSTNTVYTFTMDLQKQ